MATSVSDDSAGARRQRQAQRGLSRLLVRDVRKLRRLIIPSRLQETVPDWIEAVRAVVGEYGNASSAAAADFYEAERVAAQVTGRFTVPLLESPPDEQVDNSLRWATKDLWPRDPEDPKTTAAQRAPLEARLDAAEKKAEGLPRSWSRTRGGAPFRLRSSRIVWLSATPAPRRWVLAPSAASWLPAAWSTSGIPLTSGLMTAVTAA